MTSFTDDKYNEKMSSFSEEVLNEKMSSFPKQGKGMPFFTHELFELHRQTIP